MDTTPPPAPQWAVVELMGHGRAAGLVSKDTAFGTPMLRLDVPQHDGTFATQFINPQSIYRMSLCEEAVARLAAKDCRSAPVSEWSLKHLLPSTKESEPGADSFQF